MAEIELSPTLTERIGRSGARENEMPASSGKKPTGREALKRVLKKNDEMKVKDLCEAAQKTTTVPASGSNRLRRRRTSSSRLAHGVVTLLLLVMIVTESMRFPSTARRLQPVAS